MGILTSVITKLNPAGLMAKVYKWLAIVGVVLGIAIGSFLYGKHLGNLNSKVVIAQYEKLKEDLANNIQGVEVHIVDRIVTQYVEKVVHIKDVGETNEKVIIQYVHDSELLSNGWVYSHNSSAAGESIDPARASDGTPSTIAANQALAVVNDNYATCNATREELLSLQDFINEHNAAVAKANADIKKSK